MIPFKVGSLIRFKHVYDNDIGGYKYIVYYDVEHVSMLRNAKTQEFKVSEFSRGIILEIENYESFTVYSRSGNSFSCGYVKVLFTSEDGTIIKGWIHPQYIRVIIK